jgi:hypothetical protein
MGRAILLVVILVSTVYAGIIINVQKEMYKLPDVIVDNFLSKQSENVNDYALRAAVRLGTEDFTLPTGRDTLTVFFDGQTQLTNHFGNYTQAGVSIQKIFYQRMTGGYYQAKTYTRAIMQGRTLNYSGQIAYDYPDGPVDGPMVLYNDYQAQTHSNNDKYLPCQVTLADGSCIEGLVCGMGNKNTLHYSPHGLDKYFSGGGGTHKCLQFGAAKTNGTSGNYAWIQTPNPHLPAATLGQYINRLHATNQFSVALYVTPASGFTYGTLYWAASDPTHSWPTTAVGYNRPAAAIWYNTIAGVKTMHFGVTVNDATANGTYYEVTKPNFDITNWHMYTLVFSNGVLSAYYDTQLVNSITTGTATTIKNMAYGFTLGMRDIRSDSPTPLCPTGIIQNSPDYMFYNGLMDQISYWDQALTPQAISNWFNNYVDATQKYYIRD